MATSVKNESIKFRVHLKGSLQGLIECDSWIDFVDKVVGCPGWDAKHGGGLTKGDVLFFSDSNPDQGELQGIKASDRTNVLALAEDHTTKLEAWEEGGHAGPKPVGETIMVMHKSEQSSKTETFVPKTHTRVVTSLNSNISPVTAFEEVIENAIEATWNEAAPKISVEVNVHGVGTITVKDNGCGMTKAQLIAYSQIGVDRKMERMKNEEREEVSTPLGCSAGFREGVVRPPLAAPEIA